MRTNATNVGSHQKVRATRQEEMEAMDSLGPLTKAVLNESSFSWSALAVLRRMQQYGLSPQNTEHDKRIADELARIDANNVLLEQIA